MGDHCGAGVSNDLPLHDVYIDSFYMDIYDVTNQQYCDYLNSAYSQGLIDVSGDSVSKTDNKGSKAGKTRSFEIYPGVQMEFVWIPPGVFKMGSPESERCHKKHEGPVHKVEISRGFWMGKYEVSQGQWEPVMGFNPSKFKGFSKPVEEVSWNDVQDFIRKLNDRIRHNSYRLPTEAEWEYACRAGTRTSFNTGTCISTKQANYNGHYSFTGCEKGSFRNSTVDVGSFPPNNWGLHDMHGNVYEWCSDRYNLRGYSDSRLKDPQGPSEGKFRVLRGGSWIFPDYSLRCASRAGHYPDYQVNCIGFRLVRPVE
jgi:formylglycine-generating enzyme required for sulfatase activity